MQLNIFRLKVTFVLTSNIFKVTFVLTSNIFKLLVVR